jgi:hypothetical protein
MNDVMLQLQPVPGQPGLFRDPSTGRCTNIREFRGIPRKKVRLKRGESFVYQKKMSYLIAYDYASGSADRYTLMVLNAGDPIVAGREIPLALCREIIADLEEQIGSDYYGKRQDALKCVKDVARRRGRER